MAEDVGDAVLMFRLGENNDSYIPQRMSSYLVRKLENGNHNEKSQERVKTKQLFYCSAFCLNMYYGILWHLI